MARIMPQIVRDEAEKLVDLCENTNDVHLWKLAKELREQWGMMEQETPPKPANLDYLGIRKKA